MGLRCHFLKQLRLQRGSAWTSVGIRTPSSMPWSSQGCFVILGDPVQEQSDTGKEKACLCRSLAHCIRFPGCWNKRPHVQGLKSTHNVTSYSSGGRKCERSVKGIKSRCWQTGISFQRLGIGGQGVHFLAFRCFSMLPTFFDSRSHY